MPSWCYQMLGEKRRVLKNTDERFAVQFCQQLKHSHWRVMAHRYAGSVLAKVCAVLALLDEISALYIYA